MESYEILWNMTLPELEKTVTSISYKTFIATLFPADVIDNKLVLCAKGQIMYDAVMRDTLAVKIREALKRTNPEIQDFILYNACTMEEYRQIREEEGDISDTIVDKGMPINPKFTFESFVVGPSNEFLVAAAKAVAEHPGDSYNPLFIYGGTGLGKTHMLMAIANYLKVHNPTLNVLYATCEQFTNQMMESISRGKNAPADFRRKYRNVDVLLIDDVQFLSKKAGTQMEFFHTFNELVMQNKQIVLTCDTPPSEIDVLEDRLRTRFEGGLLADVQPPNLETRVAILRKKAEEAKCIVDIKVLTYIAEMDETDVRSLIGKLTRVIFASKLHECPITISLVDEAIKESASEKQEELKVEDIITCVSNFYKISKNDLVGKKKNKEFVEPRQVCIYVITEMMNLPLYTVGQKMGGRDHSTVIFSRNKIAKQIKTDSKLATEVNDIKKMLLKQ